MKIRPKGFDYMKTATIVYSEYKDGKWSPLQSSSDDTIRINVMAGSLHYALEVFEGLKAYHGADGKVRIFRPSENAARMARSARFLGMPEVPEDMFTEACIRAVKENIDYLPDYDTRCSMYIRPFIYADNPQVNLVTGTEFKFIVAVVPVGSYTGTGLTPTKVMLVKDQDRAAPQGTGSYKIGANYASSLLAGVKAHEEGYSAILYLDAKEKKYIDEFGSANFFAIKGNSYITPDSPSVLPSITNKSLCTLASDAGMTVERRHIPFEELSTFDEAGACGTALVITPVCEVYDKLDDKHYHIGSQSEVGPRSQALYDELTGIQFGEREDRHGWCVILDVTK